MGHPRAIHQHGDQPHAPGQRRCGPAVLRHDRRVENVIVAVYTTYATSRSHALTGRDLYVQDDWFEDPARMAAAFPADHAFATKPALALGQAKRAGAGAISVTRWPRV